MCEELPARQRKGCIGAVIDDGHVVVVIRARFS